MIFITTDRQEHRRTSSLRGLRCLPIIYSAHILTLCLSGTYKAEAYSPQAQAFSPTSELTILFTVEETFDNDHRVVTQSSPSSPSLTKFTFSAADSGLHRLCFTPSGPAAISVHGWFSDSGNVLGGVKLSVDMAIGETSKIESEDKGKIEGMVGKVRELNGRLQDIRREQIFQRVSQYNLDPPVGKGDVMLTNVLGERSRIPRSIRSCERKNRPVVVDPAGCAGCHLRLAVVAS
jgi:hypothetical protein